MRKSEEAERGCFAKAADDEPVFVLRASDIIAPEHVEGWADMAERICPESPQIRAKIMEARHCADMMRKWPDRKLPD